MRIERLSDHRHWIDQVARWHFEEWGILTGCTSLGQYVAMVERFAEDDAMPFVLVAFSGRELLGTASILVHDLEIRRELSPWFGQFFVTPPHRKHGIGTALLRAATEEARRLGIATLYLYTSGRDLPVYYSRHGWIFREKVRYLDEERTIMQYGLAAKQDQASES